MRKMRNELRRTAVAVQVFCVMLLIVSRDARAQTETVLYSFCPQAGCDDGASPYSGLVIDKEGNLYGTTAYGGANHYYGAVFKVSPNGVETVLHSFNEDGKDGYDPAAALAVDKKGNVFGTTYEGGTHGFGTVFEVSAAGSETVLYSFNPGNGKDGVDPYAGLVRDKSGNLYGTNVNNGANGHGTLYKVSSSGAETVLYSFGAYSGDGEYPSYGLTVDKNGNVYGTTGSGGVYGQGTVFEYSTSGVETVLYSFNPANGTDGQFPGALIVEARGNLYGTTSSGGTFGDGTVYKLTPNGVETILHSFNYNGGTDGAAPDGLILGKNGVLYGTTLGGGANVGAGYPGTVFQVTKKGVEKVLYSFGSQSGDGYWPTSGLVRDKSGNLYGTTEMGGASGAGTVFKVTP